MKTMSQRNFEANNNYVKSISQSIETLVSHTLNSNYYLLLDPKIKKLMSDIMQHDVSLQSEKSREAIEKEVMDNLIMYKNDMTGISFITKGYRLSRGDELLFSYRELQKSPFFKEIGKSPNRFVLVKSNNSGDPVINNLISGGIYFAGLTKVKNTQYIVFLKTRPEFATFDNIALELMITDEDGKLIWKNTDTVKQEILNAVLDHAKKQANGSFKLPQKTPSKSVYFTVSQPNGWIYTCIIDESQKDKYKQKILFFMLCSGIVLLILFNLISFAISKWLIRPLNLLIENIKKIRHFDDHQKIKTHTGFFHRLGRRISFKGKLFMYYCFIILLPSCCLVLASYMYSHNLMMLQVERSMLQTMKLATKNVEFLMDNVERISAYLAVNSYLQRLLIHGVAAIATNPVSDIIMNQKLVGEGISSIDLYNAEKRLIYSTQPEIAYLGKDYTVNDYFQDDFVGKKWQATRKDVFSNYSYMPFVRLVRSTDNMAKLGYLVVRIQERLFYEKTKLVELGSQSQVMIVNKSSFILSAKDTDLITGGISEFFSENTDMDWDNTVDYEGSEYYIYSVPVRSLWNLVFLVPKMEMMSDSVNILISDATALIIIIVIIFFAIGIMSKRIVKPLSMIKASMEGIHLEEMFVEWKINSRDELGELANAFQHMLRRLNSLLHEVYIHQLKERELESRKNEVQLISLQYQINPHFLYNTFASIKFLMKLGEIDKAIKMITAMGRLFHKAVHDEQVVIMKDEIDYVKAYITIQEIRYKDKVNVVWNLEEGIFDYKSLKFMLQPIVENAIDHGVFDSSSAIFIRVHGKVDQNRIIFEIFDNGPGIEESKLINIRKTIEGKGNLNGIGLKNVNDRIRLYFGEEYGLRIESIFGKETKVTVTIPAIR